MKSKYHRSKGLVPNPEIEIEYERQKRAERVENLSIIAIVLSAVALTFVLILVFGFVSRG